MAKNSNYANLMAEIKNLKAKADMLRNEETTSAIKSIKAQMAEFGLTLEDLGATTKTAAREKVVHTRRKPEAKFKDPVTGAVWTGRGKVPMWMKPALAQGKTKEAFAIS